MKKIIILMIFYISISNAYADYEDKREYDPAPIIDIKKDTKAKEPPFPEKETLLAGGADIKEMPKLDLKNYVEGEWNNKQSLWLCRRITDQIDNIEKQQNKIINILIDGFADGLKNTGITVRRESVYAECAKNIDFAKKINDEQLADLRACHIQEQLREMLRDKSYFLSVEMTKSFYDEPDGGLSGDNYRKVEVKVKYSDKK